MRAKETVLYTLADVDNEVVTQAVEVKRIEAVAEEKLDDEPELEKLGRAVTLAVALGEGIESTIGAPVDRIPNCVDQIT